MWGKNKSHRVFPYSIFLTGEIREYKFFPPSQKSEAGKEKRKSYCGGGQDAKFLHKSKCRKGDSQALFKRIEQKIL